MELHGFYGCCSATVLSGIYEGMDKKKFKELIEEGAEREDDLGHFEDAAVLAVSRGAGQARGLEKLGFKKLCEFETAHEFENTMLGLWIYKPAGKLKITK